MTRAPIVLLAAGLGLVAGAYALAFVGAFAIAPWSLALGSTAILSAILWLGARRRGRTPRALGLVILIVALSTALGVAVALLAPPPAADGPLLFGVPRVTALLLILIGLVPLLLLPLAYALRFDRDVMPRDG